MRAKITASMIILLFVSFCFVAFAQEGVEDADETLDCQAREELVDSKIDGYLARETEHTLTYQTLWLRAAALARKADIYGLETDDLYDDLDELDGLTNEFSANFDTFIESLTDTRDYVCSSNESLYANSLRLTREALDDVRETAREIAEFYEEGMRDHILDLKEEADE